MKKEKDKVIERIRKRITPETKERVRKHIECLLNKK